MRCGFCVCHEVDSHFCGKCAENIPSSEARLKKNRCSNCYDCPSCQHQLSIRVSSAGQKSSTDQKATPKKVYYLACSFCRWNTRDVGIPDQSVASGGWPERENVHANRLATIQEKYKSVVLWEKQQRLDKEKKKHIQRGKYITMTDKTGLTAAMIRKRVGLPELPQSALKPNDTSVSASVAREHVEGLPDDIFTKPLNLIEVTTLEQRLLQPEWQPENVNLLFPIHKHLSVKRSLRCRTCEHNVSKPEYNPNSIKFKIQLFAYYHIPEVRIVTVEPLRAGQVSELIVKLCNPTQHQTTVTFLPIQGAGTSSGAETEISDSDGKQPSETAAQGSALPTTLLHSPLSARQPFITVKPRAVNIPLSADIALPDTSVILSLRDDAAEYDDSGDSHNFQDNPKFVMWRKSNKVALKFKVTPSADLNIGEKVVVGFTLQHIYVNTISTVENKEPQKCEHQQPHNSGSKFRLTELSQ
ncbi:Dynactin 4 p62 subunit [Carabus blaptoides fortunei]